MALECTWFVSPKVATYVISRCILANHDQ